MAVPKPANVRLTKSGQTFNITWDKADQSLVGRIYTELEITTADGKKRPYQYRYLDKSVTSTSFTVDERQFYPLATTGSDLSKRIVSVRAWVTFDDLRYRNGRATNVTMAYPYPDKPTNLKVARDGRTFTATWTKGSKDMFKQSVQWVVYDTAGKSFNMGTTVVNDTTASSTFTLSTGSYYPYAPSGRKVAAVGIVVASLGIRGSVSASAKLSVPAVPAPTGIAITRTGAKFSATWKAPDASIVVYQKLEWIVNDTNGKVKVVSTSKVGSSVREGAYTLPVASYYPDGMANVKSVQLRITNMGIRGDGVASSSFSLSKPANPKLSFTMSDTTLGFKVESKDAPAAWWRKTLYEVRRYELRNGSEHYASRSTYETPAAERTGTLSSTDNPTYPTRYVVMATALGPNGASSEVSATRYLSVPSAPASVAASKVNDNGYTITWAYNGGAWRPVDSFELYYKDVDQSTALTNAALGDDPASWSSCKSGISGGARRAQTDILPAVAEGKRRHFCVVAKHDSNWAKSAPAAFVDWGKPVGVSNVEAKPQSNRLVATWELPENIAPNAKVQVFLDSASSAKATLANTANTWTSAVISDDKPHKVGVRVYIPAANGSAAQVSPIVWSDPDVAHVYGVKNLSVAAREDGATVDVTWTNVSGSTAANGITVAWSTHPDAFISNEPPTTADFTDAVVGDCDKCAHLVVYGLEKGKKYHFWLRKWHDGGDSTVYGDWSKATIGLGGTSLALGGVVQEPSLGISRSWVNSKRTTVQVQWSCLYDEDNPPKGASITVRDSSNNVKRTYTFGKGVDSAEIDLKGYAPGIYTISCVIMNANGAATCPPVTVEMVTAPTATLTPTSLDSETVNGETELVCAVLPLEFTCAGTGDMRFRIYAWHDYALEMPDGTKRLTAGDVVYQVVPNQQVSVEDIELMDGAIYVAELVSANPTSGEESEPAQVRFRVDWDRKAQPPTGEVTVDADALSVMISATPHEDADEADMCDLYRVTPDGTYPIERGAEWETAYLDGYAPYNWDDCRVRIACRTDYGSVAWVDVPYQLDFKAVRIDWLEGYVELPYNINIDDSRVKEHTVRGYQDGSRRAFVKPAIQRSVNIASDIQYDIGDETLVPLYALSRWAGTALVRTPNGHAYPAVVGVSFGEGVDKAGTSVSVSITETDLNGEFGAVKANVEIEGNGE